MSAKLTYAEEAFGILTDDELYLDAILIKPANATDRDLKVIRAWVPKYPLTKSSVLSCARQEVKSYGPDGKIAHLVFDLRGTGESDGLPGDHDFNQDLSAVKAWAEERFGTRTNFGFFGFPQSRVGRVYMWPLRPGTVLESYHYPPNSAELAPPTLLYLSSYGNFSRKDDALCIALAEAGYSVFGLDPFRYLLHASINGPLLPDQLWDDVRLLIQMLPTEPYVVAQPLSAGLAMLWSARTPGIQGVVAVGRAQSGLAPEHVFHTQNPRTYFLPRHVADIAPRPLALVHLEGHTMGGNKKRMQVLFDSSRSPHRLEHAADLTPDLLLELLSWMRTLRAKNHAAPSTAPENQGK